MGYTKNHFIKRIKSQKIFRRTALSWPIDSYGESPISKNYRLSGLALLQTITSSTHSKTFLPNSLTYLSDNMIHCIKIKVHVYQNTCTPSCIPAQNTHIKIHLASKCSSGIVTFWGKNSLYLTWKEYRTWHS